MKRRSQETRRSVASKLRLIAVPLLMLALLVGPAGGVLGQDSGESDRIQVRFVHVSPGLGAVDVYVDGNLFLVGINFGAISDPIRFDRGDHSVVVAPSGASADEAVLDATVSLPDAANVDLSLLGPAEDPGLAAHPVDLSPLPPDMARFNVVLGSQDVGPIDIELTGGDQLFPTVEYLGATEYADVAAGVYDLEASYAGVATIVLEMPGIVLDAGVVYTVFVVGEAAVGELQSVVSGWEADPVVLEGQPATIRTGDCEGVANGEVVADLTLVAVSPFGAPVGAERAAGTESSFTVVGIPFEDLIGPAHAIVIAGAQAESEVIVACGEIGGTLSDDGSLVVGLREQAGSGVVGMAVLAPNVIEPGVTDVSLFVSSDLVSGEGEAGAEPDDALADDSPPVVIVAPDVTGAGATPEAGP